MAATPVRRVVLVGHDRHGKRTLAAALARRLGDDWRIECGHESLDSSPAQVVLVVSVADGPMPGTRDALQRIAPTGNRRFCILLNKLDLVDDRDLVELVEMEVRELVENETGITAESVPSFRGAATTEEGIDALVEHLRTFHTIPLRPRPEPAVSAKSTAERLLNSEVDRALLIVAVLQARNGDRAGGIDTIQRQFSLSRDVAEVVLTLADARIGNLADKPAKRGCAAVLLLIASLALIASA